MVGEDLNKVGDNNWFELERELAGARIGYKHSNKNQSF